MFMETIPQWLAVGAMLSLIFGGCCSNVSLLAATSSEQLEQRLTMEFRSLLWRLL
jgi:hypothetical protein